MRKLVESFVIGFALLSMIVLGGRYPHERYIAVTSSALKATVSIAVRGKTKGIDPKAAGIIGAGAFISPNGHVLTCAHLFTSLDITTITIKTYSGDELRGDLLYVDIYRDLALVKVIKKTPFLKLGHYRDLRVGEEVLALGSPLGMEFTVSRGIISQLDRYQLTLTNLIQTDAAINPGNSGGPLINLAGEIIGVNTLGLSPHGGSCGLNFAQSIKEIRSFLARFKGLEGAF